MSTLSAQQLTLKTPEKTLLENLSITFLPGEVWGILGPNGVGKTTFLQTLAGLQKPNAGTIFLNDKNILMTPARDRAKQMGILLQRQECTFPLSVFDWVLAGRYPHDRAFSQQSTQDQKMVCAALETMHILPLQHKSVLQLSGGELQRVFLATLLAQAPDIYLLDEPLNHLDTAQQIETLSLFKQLAKIHQKTIILVLHHLKWLQTFCDHIMVWLPDQTPEIGTPEMMLNKATLSRYLSIESLMMDLIGI